MLTRSRRVAFVDLVSTGDTFGRLTTLLCNWAEEEHYDWNAVRRRIRIVSITKRRKTSPKTWRWQQHVPWVRLLSTGAVKNVSIEPDFWEYLGGFQEKVSPSYTADRWGDAKMSSPARSAPQLHALRLALDLFELGRTQQQRHKFASLLVKEPAMKHAWFRALVQEIRR